MSNKNKFHENVVVQGLAGRPIKPRVIRPFGLYLCPLEFTRIEAGSQSHYECATRGHLIGPWKGLGAVRWRVIFEGVRWE